MLIWQQMKKKTKKTCFFICENSIDLATNGEKKHTFS